jgi:hypothetical protein
LPITETEDSEILSDTDESVVGLNDSTSVILFSLLELFLREKDMLLKEGNLGSDGREGSEVITVLVLRKFNFRNEVREGSSPN